MQSLQRVYCEQPGKRGGGGERKEGGAGKGGDGGREGEIEKWSGEERTSQASKKPTSNHDNRGKVKYAAPQMLLYL